MKWFLVFSFWFLSYNLSNGQAQLKIYQIDVNTGDAALIVSPTNKYILLDAGDDRYNYGDTVLRFLRNLDITHLDNIIVSHYHQDHIGGIPRVIYGLSGTNTNDSLLGWCYDRGDTYTTSTFINYKNAVGSKRRTIGLGETLDLGAGAFMFCVAKNGKVMNGDSVLPNTEENYRSLVWVLQYGRFRFYTGGDLVGYNVSGERDVETKVAPVIGKVDVIKVNHHGSRNSSNPTFLDSLRPKSAIISQGVHPVNNNHPHQEALDRLAQRNIYIYQMNTNPTGGVIPTGHGRILNTSAIITVNKASYTINGDEYLLSGVQRDGACLSILSLPDTILEQTIITPKALIQNLGNETESFRVRFKIESGYNRTKTIYDLAPNDTMTVTFDTAWSAIRGVYQVSCSTEVFGDTNPDNDKQTRSLVVAYYDSEIAEILSPQPNGSYYFTETIMPTVVIKDNSQFAYPSLVNIYCLIKNDSTVYYDSLRVLSLPGAIDTISFTPFVLQGLASGAYICSVWVARDIDLMGTNNTATVQFNVVDPTGISERDVTPNVNSFLNFKIVAYKLYDVNGRVVKFQHFSDVSNVNLNSDDWLKNISSGIYFLHITKVPYDKEMGDQNGLQYNNTKSVAESYIDKAVFDLINKNLYRISGEIKSIQKIVKLK